MGEIAQIRPPETGGTGLTWDGRAAGVAVAARGKAGRTPQFAPHREASLQSGPPVPAGRVLRQRQTPVPLQHAIPQELFSRWSRGRKSRLNGARSEMSRTNAGAAPEVPAMRGENRPAARGRDVQRWGVESGIGFHELA